MIAKHIKINARPGPRPAFVKNKGIRFSDLSWRHHSSKTCGFEFFKKPQMHEIYDRKIVKIKDCPVCNIRLVRPRFFM